MVARSVAKQLAMKLKLEKKLKPKLRKLFRQIGQDVKVVWATTQRVPGLNSFHIELTTILRQHYRDVAKEFGKISREGVKSSIRVDETKLLVEEIPGVTDTFINSPTIIAAATLTLLEGLIRSESEVISYINTHSIEQSRHILDTTAKTLESVSKKVIMDSVIEGEVLTPAETAARIQREFYRSSENRIDTIAKTETQTPSETIKLIETTVLATLLGGIVGPEGEFELGTVVKTWNTVIDGETRDSHLAANGQTVPNDSPFKVGGESLPAPGSSVLGASLKNIINCRCIATYDVSGGGTLPVNITLQ
jgi:hypothetical protein